MGMFSMKWFTEDLGLKVLSVLIALFLWYMVNFTGSSEVSYQIPIEFQNVPANTEIVWESSRTVTIWMSGQERAIKNLSPTMVKAWVDLAEAKTGESYHQLSQANVEVPTEVNLVRMSPTVIRVLLDRVITKDLVVKPSLEGNPAPGYRVEKVEVMPKKVIAEGVRRFLSDSKEVMTDKVDISGISSDTTFQARLYDNGAGIRISSDMVTVTVRVRPETAGVPATAP